MNDRADRVFEDGRIRRAFRYISDHASDIEADQVRLTQIPAPPFGEERRAREFMRAWSSLELHAQLDAAGNVIVPYAGAGPNPVVIAVHLDTVFPESIPLQLQRNGRVLSLPGISDNGAGIVALLWALRAGREADIRFRKPVIGVGTVGEEGEGNLRGVRHLFEMPPWPGRDCQFIAVDGAGFQRVTHRALGSRRLRVRMKGPGGHSWADFGRPNPVEVMASAIHDFTATAVRRPGSSFNFGVVHGGISVNVIPRDAVMEVDLRSTVAPSLDALESQLKRAVDEAVRSARIECAFELIGDRPSGATPLASEVVQAAMEATRRFGFDPHPDIGSTDANIPIALGLPAIAIGGGGASGNIHTPDEWFDPLHREMGVQRLLAVIAILAGLE